MKTEDLIAALAADGATVETPPARRAGTALLVGALIAAVVFAVLIGPRPDWRAAIETVRFPFKFVPFVLLAIGGIGGLIRLSRPDGRLGVFAAILALAAGLLLGSVVVELAVVPADRWARLAIGHNAPHCLTLTPFLAIAPLAAALLAARHGATTRPALTGAVAGLAAAGVGATLYAMNCTDDSPLFVALWYPLAVAIVAGAGALFGRRLLVW
ncbi:NrsF family protein [Pinisolibacter aquiterrae]|uniref:NrsF family protein n=1 Tax=Pinisolibacter aquiterrae TaxID=2815579 RepID=UPI001C3C4FE1|nr:NrsF family protein [Pinisolibacter aquiterrae]MBV5265605.1 DUF1109 family protein [Pinisolibacter aquiterrae]MCC8236829.1 NrsF family protein [Pinisolibacter aquiterrae]